MPETPKTFIEHIKSAASAVWTGVKSLVTSNDSATSEPSLDEPTAEDSPQTNPLDAEMLTETQTPEPLAEGSLAVGVAADVTEDTTQSSHTNSTDMTATPNGSALGDAEPTSATDIPKVGAAPTSTAIPSPSTNSGGSGLKNIMSGAMSSVAKAFKSMSPTKQSLGSSTPGVDAAVGVPDVGSAETPRTDSETSTVTGSSNTPIVDPVTDSIPEHSDTSKAAGSDTAVLEASPFYSKGAEAMVSASDEASNSGAEFIDPDASDSFYEDTGVTGNLNTDQPTAGASTSDADVPSIAEATQRSVTSDGSIDVTSGEVPGMSNKPGKGSNPDSVYATGNKGATTLPSVDAVKPSDTPVVDADRSDNSDAMTEFSTQEAGNRSVSTSSIKGNSSASGPAGSSENMYKLKESGRSTVDGTLQLRVDGIPAGELQLDGRLDD